MFFKPCSQTYLAISSFLLFVQEIYNSKSNYYMTCRGKPSSELILYDFLKSFEDLIILK